MKALTIAFLPVIAAVASAQCEDAQLTASDAASGDELGFSVAIDGDVVVVGAPLDDDLGTSSGAAYVFERTGTVWTETTKLVPADGASLDKFGDAVAVSGGTIFVGAPSDDDPPNSGSVYVFDRGPTGWSETTKIVPQIALPNDQLGQALALQGDTACLGASGHDFPHNNAGLVYVYHRTANVWNLQAEAYGFNADEGSLYGSSLGLDGDRFVSGARNHDGGAPNSGAAFVYQRMVSVWSEEAELSAGDGQTSDEFGRASAISGSTIAIGAPRADAAGTDSGAVYIFEFDFFTGWTETQKIVPDDLGDEDRFGDSLALSGDTLVVGSYWDDDAGTNAGAAYVFARGATEWELRSKLSMLDAETMDRGGDAVGLSGNTLVFGAARSDGAGSSSGSAYVVDVTPAVMPYCEAAANSTGAPAPLRLEGCPRISVNNVALEAGPVVPSMPAVFYYGASSIMVPFGNGFRCVGGSVYRLFPFAIADGAGVLRKDLDITMPPGGTSGGGQITPGSTWFFQAWYRDPGGGGLGFNLSNGLAVTFEP